jgi:hypothetical protein
MGVAYASNERKITAFAAAALLLSSLSLGGCATSTAGSSLMDARAEAPAPPKASVYLPVEDLPPKREKPAMRPYSESRPKTSFVGTRFSGLPGQAALASGAAARDSVVGTDRHPCSPQIPDSPAAFLESCRGYPPISSPAIFGARCRACRSQNSGSDRQSQRAA